MLIVAVGWAGEWVCGVELWLGIVAVGVVGVVGQSNTSGGGGVKVVVVG